VLQLSARARIFLGNDIQELGFKGISFQARQADQVGMPVALTKAHPQLTTELHQIKRNQEHRRLRMRKQKGFSLIELLIVVAIILIIAAIAIPNLLRSRIAANEASAVGSMRTINTAEVTYASTYPEQGFAGSLATLGGTGTTASSDAALLLDNVLGNSTPGGTAGSPNTKSGYDFWVVPSGTAPYPSYSANGDPKIEDQTGKRRFFTNASGVIRYNSTATATEADQPI
jgi:type IV pilus assembly protein PilA